MAEQNNSNTVIKSENIYIIISTFINMKKYICTVCDWVYDPEIGDPDNGIAPGTAFEDIPDSWVCPVCGVGKEDFEPLPEE